MCMLSLSIGDAQRKGTSHHLMTNNNMVIGNPFLSVTHKSIFHISLGPPLISLAIIISLSPPTFQKVAAFVTITSSFVIFQTFNYL